MTVVNRRPSRRSTTVSRRANASLEAAMSCSPSPTSARRPSLDTTWWAANHRCAQVDLPAPAGPTSTTTHGEGSTIGPSLESAIALAR